ncbi:hypothetical protein D3C74_159850 [compost metagenome]
MSCLTVTTDPDGSTGISSLKIDDVIFLESNPKIKDGLIVHTRDKEYFMVGSLRYWTTVLNNSGYNFSVVDRSNSINVEQIVWLDKLYKVAYFEQELSKRSKRCTIAFHRYKAVEQELMLVNPTISFA